MKVPETLIELGWTEEPDRLKRGARCFYKRYRVDAQCALNQRDTLPVHIYMYDSASLEMELSAQLKDGTWIRFLNYGLPSDLEAVIKTIPRLLATWEFMASQ